MTSIYVIDTSSLIDLQQNYPRKIFSPVWKNFEILIHEKRIVSPIEVYKEIHPDSVLREWCNNNKTMFVKNNRAIIDFVTKIVNEFPKWIDPNKLSPIADPFIIGLAHSLKNNLDGYEPIILTQESNRPNKIPFVANTYNIKSMNLLDFFNNENWAF